MGALDYASDRALAADLRHYEDRRPAPVPHALDQLDRERRPSQPVRLLVGDILAELPPAALDEIADQIHHAHVTGRAIDHAAIGRAVADYVVQRVTS